MLVPVAGGEPFVIPSSSVNSSPSPDPPHASQTLSSPAEAGGIYYVFYTQWLPSNPNPMARQEGTGVDVSFMDLIEITSNTLLTTQ